MQKKSKWPDFIFTIAVRFICGTGLGILACFLFGWRGILRAFSHNNTSWPLIWLVLCSLIGGIIAVFTVPRWQTPWFKRDSEALNLGAELASLSQAQPDSCMVRKSVIIKTVGEDGEQHEYSSMEEAPPEIRSQIEALEREAARESGSELSVAEASRRGNAINLKIIQRKNISVYKVVDESGVERTYHSLEEMPAEIRAAIADAEKKPEV